MGFNPDAFLRELTRQRGYAGQLVHQKRMPARAARYGSLRTRLAPPAEAALRAAGVERLYLHQAEAINAALAGQNVVIATSTASGKTLCFHVPVLDALARDPLARAMYLYPTKALSQDQLGKWQALAKPVANAAAATYDGDTPQAARARIRRRTRVLITNPDMLHVGILPNHPLWAEFFRHLRYVVIDEAHSYRGVFGSQVACVIRRLRRICALHQQGGGPQFIAASATIANPGEHIELLTGLPATVVTDDGSPHGPRTFALWNPPFLDETRTARRSANREATVLFTTLVESGVRTISFARTRVVAELLLRYARNELRKTNPELVKQIAAYRAGYLAEERRRIERELFEGRLRGVTATTALELGIDVGELDAAVLVGYPGTIASMWQQAGRAGRDRDPSLAMLIGLNNPLDQYYMRHPDELFDRPHEHALIDPDNVYVLQRHLACAAHEAPLQVPGEGEPKPVGALGDDETLFGPGFVPAMVTLENQGLVRYDGRRWTYTRGDYPAQNTNLRDARGERFAVLDGDRDNQTLEELSASQAPFRVHPGAVYLHQGESYEVTEYNEAMRYAVVQRSKGDFYTQPREWNDVRIVRSVRHATFPAAPAYYGMIRVRSQVTGYRRLQQFTEAVLGDVELEMPANDYDTMGMWWDLPDDLPGQLAGPGARLPGRDPRSRTCRDRHPAAVCHV